MSRIGLMRNSGRVFVTLAMMASFLFAMPPSVQAQEPDNLTLAPQNETNAVNTDHTLTATVTDEGNPVEGVTVLFEVESEGNPDPGSGTAQTNELGEAPFTYTNDTAGDDTITACVAEDVSENAAPDWQCVEPEVSDTANKTWEEREAASLTLDPQDETNAVNTDHTVTATVLDQEEDPIEGVLVLFEVDDEGNPNPDSETHATDDDGEAEFTFTNDQEVTNQITACVAEPVLGEPPTVECVTPEISDTASKTWEERVASSLTLDPQEATNAVGTDHTVTATVTDQFDDPVEGETVLFEVSNEGNPTPDEGSDVTDENGEAEFTFTNDQEVTNTITACVADAAFELPIIGPILEDCAEGEDLSDTATKEWQERVASSLDLDPQEDTNSVVQAHIVTANVTDQFDDPMAGETVLFQVSGDGNPDPDEGTDNTNAGGDAEFTFTNDTAGENEIFACVAEDVSENAAPDWQCVEPEVSDTANKTWIDRLPARNVSVDPEEGQNEPEDFHIIIATVTDREGEPVEGAPVDWTHEGAGEVILQQNVTDANGQAGIAITSEEEGVTTITADITDDPANECDLDADVPEQGDPAGNCIAIATKQWQVETVPRAGAGALCTEENEGRTFNIEGGGQVIVGTSEDDVLNGTPGDDIICGRGGNDTIRGRAGDDILLGGPGNDVIHGGAGHDLIRGGGGHDLIRGGRGNDRLRGGGGNDELFGDGGRDDLRGGNGHDTLNGGKGRDTMRAGRGNDLLRDTQGRRNFFNGGPGNDTCIGRRNRGNIYRRCNTLRQVG